MGVEKEQPTTIAEVSRIVEADLDEVITMGLSAAEIQTGTDSPQFYFKETLQRWI